MIRIESKRNKFTYNIYHIVKAFYPGEEVEQKVDAQQESLVTLHMPGDSSFSVLPEQYSGIRAVCQWLRPRQTLGAKSIRMGKISSRPRSISRMSTTLER